MKDPNIDPLTYTEKLVLKTIAKMNGLATYGIIKDAIHKPEDTVHRIIGKMICFKLIGVEILDGKASFFVID